MQAAGPTKGVAGLRGVQFTLLKTAAPTLRLKKGMKLPGNGFYLWAWTYPRFSAILSLQTGNNARGIKMDRLAKDGKRQAAQQILMLAKALGYKYYQVADALGLKKSTISRWYSGETVPDDDNWPKLLELRKRLKATGKLINGGEHVNQTHVKPWARVAQQVLILAAALGYKQYQVADALGISKGAVSYWHSGEQEPNEDNWAKLLELKERLETTGQLANGGLAAKGGKPPKAPVSKDERREWAKALMARMLEAADKLGLGTSMLAGKLSVRRSTLYYWQHGNAIPSMKNYHKLLKLCSILEAMKAVRVKSKAQAARQILILAIGLGYKLYQVADALGIDNGTVSRWYNGETEPCGRNWFKLLVLKQNLETTGKLVNSIEKWGD